jgi:hypothetical protein
MTAPLFLQIPGEELDAALPGDIGAGLVCVAKQAPRREM